MARRKSEAQDFLDNFNAAYNLSRSVGEDIVMARAAGAEAEDVAVGGYGAEAEAEMAGMDRSPDLWQSTVGEDQTRTYTSLADPSQTRKFGLQMQPRQRIGAYEFDKGDNAAMQNARRKHMADVRGRFDAEAGLAMHDKISAGEQRDTLFAQGQEDRQLAKMRNALTSSVMAMPKAQMDAQLASFDFAGIGLPGYSIITNADGYQMVRESEAGADAVTETIPPLQMRQFLLSQAMSNNGFGEESLLMYQNAVEGLDKKSKESLSVLSELAKSNNEAQAKAHGRVDADRDYGLGVARLNESIRNNNASNSLAERRFQAQQDQWEAEHALNERRLDATIEANQARQSAANARSGGKGGFSPTEAQYIAQFNEEVKLAASENPKATTAEVNKIASDRTAAAMGGAAASADLFERARAFAAMPEAIASGEDAGKYVALAVDRMGLSPQQAVANVPAKYREAAQGVVNAMRAEEGRAAALAAPPPPAKPQPATGGRPTYAERNAAAWEKNNAAAVERMKARTEKTAPAPVREESPARQTPRNPLVGGLNTENAAPIRPEQVLRMLSRVRSPEQAAAVVGTPEFRNLRDTAEKRRVLQLAQQVRGQ